MTTTSSPSDSEREIVSTRVFPCSPATLFQAWSDPRRLARWWGPKGFRNTFSEFDFRPGGHWRFVMHGPDGQDYPNHSVFVEVAAPERIVFDHVCAPLFQVTATFAPEGGGTRLVFRMLFETKELRERMMSFVPECNEQNFDRLEAVLAGG